MGVAEAIERQHGQGCACTRCVGFQPGHELSTRHGSYVSDMRLDEDEHVQRYFDWIVATQPTSHPADAGACWRLARVYQRIALSGKALDEADEIMGDRPIAAYATGTEKAWLASLRDDHDRWIARAGKVEEQLGRTPAARAKLSLHVGQAAAIRDDLLRRYSGDGEAA